MENFSGTITGEGRANTIWNFVPNDVSAFPYDSAYIDVPGFPSAGIRATGLHLEFPGDWKLSDMSMIANDPVRERRQDRVPRRRRRHLGRARCRHRDE